MPETQQTKGTAVSNHIHRKRGRPKATEKSLADYVHEGVDVTKLRKEIKQCLSETMGTAEDVAVLEKALIDRRLIKAPIPFKLLKLEFGELIRCTQQQLNRGERGLGIR